MFIAEVGKKISLFEYIESSPGKPVLTHENLKTRIKIMGKPVIDVRAVCLQQRLDEGITGIFLGGVNTDTYYSGIYVPDLDLFSGITVPRYTNLPKIDLYSECLVYQSDLSSEYKRVYLGPIFLKNGVPCRMSADYKFFEFRIISPIDHRWVNVPAV